MRFLILDTDYPAFLDWLYADNPALDKKPFDEQAQVHTEACFGLAGFCVTNLRALGHEAHEICINNQYMQKQWAREQGIQIADTDWEFRFRRGIIPWISRINKGRWIYEILAAQIRQYRPDIILNLAMDGISSAFLQEMKSYTRLLVGQTAAPLPQGEKWSVYDLVISSLPNFVEFFRRLGVRSELNRLAFEPSVLEKLNNPKQNILVSFVGSFTSSHSKRDQLLERLCATLPIKIWGIGIERVRPESPIRSCYMGAAWGIDMFRTLAASKMVINYHSDISQSYANNMRLFEATGTGSLLITDSKDNLHEMFEPGKEVITYRSSDECVELAQYYLEHEEERAAIARSGQLRTLTSHTYVQRMGDLCQIISKYL